jgi:hypothetical protein
VTSNDAPDDDVVHVYTAVDGATGASIPVDQSTGLPEDPEDLSAALLQLAGPAAGPDATDGFVWDFSGLFGAGDGNGPASVDDVGTGTGIDDSGGVGFDAPDYASTDYASSPNFDFGAYDFGNSDLGGFGAPNDTSTYMASNDPFGSGGIDFSGDFGGSGDGGFPDGGFGGGGFDGWWG